MKYWNRERIRKARERDKRREERNAQAGAEESRRKQTLTKGDRAKNTRLMLRALGLSIRRRMLVRLAQGGAMSVSKLSEPFGITLPATLAHVRTLEDAGLVCSKKKGRVRICVYRSHALEELAAALAGTRSWRLLDEGR